MRGSTAREVLREHKKRFLGEGQCERLPHHAKAGEEASVTVGQSGETFFVGLPSSAEPPRLSPDA